MTYSDQVSKALERFRSYIDGNAALCENHPAGRISSFWEDHFADRPNFPDVREFLTFRRENFVYGIGDTGPASLQQKREEFNAIAKSILLFTPLSFIESLREPVLGAPIVFPIGSGQLSASFVLNAGTTWRIRQLLEKFGPKRPLHFLEVGAGWGACAMQLHQVCKVASYSIVDLPENLCLSSVGLTLDNPTRSVRFIDCTPRSPVAPAEGTLNFALPPAIDNLTGPYDVILNTMSFQEMDLETVNAYFQWASRVLAPGGLLLSFNAHDKAGVTRSSEYLQDGLSLIHMAPFRCVPAGWFNTIPYEMVFLRANSVTENELAVRVDMLGELIQLGLDEDLRSSIDATLQSSREVKVLEGLQAVLYPMSESQRQQAIRLVEGKGNTVADFLAANYWFSIGNFAKARDLLEECLRNGIEGFARVRAQAMLLLMGSSLDRAALLNDAAGLSSELAALLEGGRVSAFQNHIARVLDTPLNQASAAGKFLRALKKILAQSESAVSGDLK